MLKFGLMIGSSRYAGCAALGASVGTRYMQAVGHDRFSRTQGAMLGVASHVALIAVGRLITWAYASEYLNNRPSLRAFILISPMLVMFPAMLFKKEDILALAMTIAPLVNLVISDLGNAACNYFNLEADHPYRKPFAFCRTSWLP